MTTSVYIHVPFCLTKCGYCDFFSVAYTQAALSAFVGTLLRELELFKQRYDFEAETVYFGGGTPSLLTPNQINSLLNLIGPPPQAEITLETNPVQVTPDWVEGIATTRVNRISLGVQSLQDANLQMLGRKHKADSIPGRVKQLREAGLGSISLDLLYGLPSYGNYNLQDEVDAFLELDPDHLSAYLLNIEDNVTFRHWRELLPDDQTARSQYELICDTLEQAGLQQYEISNFARPGQASRHNLRYWLGEEYVGAGAGASGLIGRQRYKRPEDLRLWQYSVERGDLLYQKESETKAQQKADFIIMQLRLVRGLELNAYRERFGSDFITDHQETIDRFLASGHLERSGDHIRLTPQARFLSNRILQEFV